MQNVNQTEINKQIEENMQKAYEWVKDYKPWQAYEYFDKVIALDSTYVEAYIGRALGTVGCPDVKYADRFGCSLSNDIDYKKALKIAEEKGVEINVLTQTDYDYRIVDGGVIVTHMKYHCDTIPDSFEGLPVIGINSMISYKNFNQTKLNLPKTIRNMPEHAFYMWRKLEEVVLPDGITVIEKDAFFGCESLKKVVLPASIKRIEEGAFANCYNLENIDISNVEYLGKNAFFNCKALEKVQFSASLKQIGSGSFENTALQQLELPDSLTDIGKAAFKNCQGLAGKSIYIPQSVKNMDACVFQDIYKVTFNCQSNAEKSDWLKNNLWIGVLNKQIVSCTVNVDK